jgi:hypothetical protein
MSTTSEQVILEKLRHLSPERVAEVEDFVDFLRTRHDERLTTRAASRAAEPAFARVWENEDDAAYDAL